jgi:hypothetical protein
MFRLRVFLAILAGCAVVLAAASLSRIAKVRKGASAIPLFTGAREAGGHTRYFPKVFSWDDRSSARVQRVFAFPAAVTLATIGRRADAQLARDGWYVVTPENLDRIEQPQVIVWQRDPDERLDLVKLWPVDGMTREQRLYGGIFPAEFLDAPLVVEWSWALGGPRTARPPAATRSILLSPP